VRALATDVPLDRLLIETDCPFLAPVPHRGRRNEPAYVIEVAKKLAEIRGESLQTIEDATTENFFHLFTEAPRP
jgi:TatD DNase family protein